MEDFLLRVVPGLAEQWQGSTPEELAQIERIAGRPLPPFYRWFLTRMGQSMGPLTYPRLDFSARRVLTCYTEELVEPHPRFLLIGYNSDDMMPLHVFYDLDLAARADARVTKRHARGGALHDQFETFREMLAYRALSSFRIDRMPQRCRTIVTGDEPDILSHLDPVMDRLGFTRPVPTGPHCGLYERHDAAMVCTKIPRDKPEAVMVFRLGGSASGTLRRIQGAIATESALRLDVREWAPPLA
ncbi:SMI1/KNR4 family protein [Archangium violaceum]|uniref:SMI1/KNR4 family protein n=1 Tax=Archangium violaceum TaxID=83451 RepID=UPI00193B3586|nr:SMI1/KNR4 family protein [Archangium violaceum]QRK11757.1 SMI1/KNR4 family protein [Archangium violaceum]